MLLLKTRWHNRRLDVFDKRNETFFNFQSYCVNINRYTHLEIPFHPYWHSFSVSLYLPLSLSLLFVFHTFECSHRHHKINFQTCFIRNSGLGWENVSMKQWLPDGLAKPSSQLIRNRKANKQLNSSSELASTALLSLQAVTAIKAAVIIVKNDMEQFNFKIIRSETRSGKEARSDAKWRKQVNVDCSMLKQILCWAN